MKLSSLLGYTPLSAKTLHRITVPDLSLSREDLLRWIKPHLDEGEVWVQRNVWDWPYCHDLAAGVSYNDVVEGNVVVEFFFIPAS